MTRKTFTIAFLLSAFTWIATAVSVQAQYPWGHISSPVSSDLTAVDFVSDQIGYVASRDGEILRTTDGGKSWTVVSQIENLGVTSIDFIDPAHGWVAGNFNVPYDTAGIFETLDSGKTWTKQFNHIFYNFEEVQFLDDSTGWMAASEISESDTLTSLMYTTTRGFSWTVAPGPRIHNALYGVHMRDEDNGIAFGDHGIFFETSNGGMHPDGTWGMNIAIPGFHKTLYGAASSGASYGCAVGQDGFVLVTNNDWYSYPDYTTTSGDTLVAVTGYSGIPLFYAVGKNGCIASIRWAIFMWMISEEDRVTSNHLNDICQVEDQVAWAVGDNGTILYHSNNYPPVAMDDFGSVRQDSSLVIHVLDNDTDMDFDLLEIYDYADGQHGVLVKPEDEQFLEFFPDDDYVGMDTMWYVVTDGNLGYDTANIIVEIREAPKGPFTEIRLENTDVAFGNAIWGDVDNDDDYDIVVSGEQSDGSKVTWYLRNDEGTFVKTMDELEGVRSNNDRSMAFTDLDTDGYLDFIITGQDSNEQPFSQLYMGSSNKFIPYNTEIPGVSNGSVDWADVDIDGDPDLLIMGSTESGKICHIYRNDGKSDADRTWSFTKISFDFYGLDHGVARFVDFNRDHLTDIVVTGSDEENRARAYSYANDLYSSFVAASLEGYAYSNLELSDFNADGNVDLYFSGKMEDEVRRAGFLTYTDSFEELPSPVDGLSQGSASWGDFDNDGDPDLVVCGINNQLASETQLYINNGGTLEKSGFLLPAMASGSVEWGDYDADGDLDLLMSGYFNSAPHRSTIILRNDLENPNDAPTAPDQFVFGTIGQFRTLSWSPGSDQESPEENLGYNFKLRRKKTPGTYIIKPASNDSLILEIPGYAATRDTIVFLTGLARGAIYEIEIQTVDAGFHVSPWAKFQFTVPSPYFQEQDFDFNATEIMSADWYYREKDSNPVLLLTERIDSAATLIQWTGTQFDTVARVPKLGSGHGPVALLDFNMDNEVDFSEYDIADTSMVIYISGGDTLHVPIEYTVHHPGACYDWGDYDGDGDPDLIIAGNLSDEAIYASMYRNDGNEMVHLYTPIHNVVDGDIAWVDIDGDGDNDVMVSGLNKHLGVITRSYENRNGGFYLKQADLPGMEFSDFDFADYDADGDMDMLLCGRGDDEVPVTKIFNNNSGEFSAADVELAPNERGSCKWVDLDMDNHNDIILVGYPENEYYGDNSAQATIYLYFDGSYDKGRILEDVPPQHLAIADYNGDGTQDLVFAGSMGGRSDIYIFKNNDHGHYQEFGNPGFLEVQAYGDSIVISWDYPEEITIPRERVTFNLQAGTYPGGTDLMSPLADETGFRKVIRPGNIPSGTTYTFHGLSPDSIFYAAVQAVDLAYYGGPFTNEIEFNPISGTLIPGEVLIGSGEQVRNAAWADTDSDGDPDLLLLMTNSVVFCENDGGNIDFSESTLLATGNFTDELLLFDPDRDNDVDLLLLSSDDPTANQVLVNESGTLTAYPFAVDGLYDADAAVGDLDNDGSPEILIMGEEEPGGSLKSLIYSRVDDGYEIYNNLLVPTYQGEIHLGDINSDSFRELVRSGTTVAGSDDPSDFEFIIDRNMGGAFDENISHIPGLRDSDLAFGDYNNNGGDDILYTGTDPYTGMPKTYFCRAYGGGYFIEDSSLIQLLEADAAWFDYNNDGLLDIVISGTNDTEDRAGEPGAKLFSGVYMSHGEGVFKQTARLHEFVNPVIAVADVDMDGRQDIFLAGQGSTGDTIGILYRNATAETATIPYVAELDDPEEDEQGVHLTWHHNHFTLERYHYNVRLGTAPGKGDVMSPLAQADGTRKLYDYGNAGRPRGFTITDLDPGTTYYVAVQGINWGKVASAWSDEVAFTTLGTGVVQDMSLSMDVQVYPVPARDKFVVEVRPGTPGEVQLGVIDPLGRELFSRRQQNDGGMTRFTVELPAGGLYLLRIRSGSDQVIRRVIVAE